MKENKMKFKVTESIIKEVEDIINNDSKDNLEILSTVDDYLMTAPIYFNLKDVPQNLYTKYTLNLNNIEFDSDNIKGILKIEDKEYMLFEPSEPFKELSISEMIRQNKKTRAKKNNKISKPKKYKKSKFLSSLEKKKLPVFKKRSEAPNFSASVSDLNKIKQRHNNSIIGIVNSENLSPYYIYDSRDTVSKTSTPRGAELFKKISDVPKNLKPKPYFNERGLQHNGIVYGILRANSKEIGEELYNINNYTIKDIDKYNEYKNTGKIYNPYIINGVKVNTKELEWTKHFKNCRNKSKDYVIIDTETTGLNSTDQIIQLSIIDLEGKVLFNSYFYTDKTINKEALNINNITMETINNAPKWKDKWETIREILKGKIIIAHNASFDIRVLSSTCKRNNIIIDFDLNYLCTMKHNNSIGHSSKGMIDILKGMGMYFNKNNFHEALFDCQGCLYIINPKNEIFKLREKAEKYYNAVKRYNTGESLKSRENKGSEWLKSNFNIDESKFAVIEKDVANSIISKLEPFVSKHKLLI